MNQLFSFHRFVLLLKTQAVSSYRSVATYSAALALIVAVNALLSPGSGGQFYVSAFGLMLYVLGAFLSSRAFSELHDKSRNSAYLLLPASSLEKTLSSLFFVTVGFVAYLLIFTTAVSIVTEILGRWLLGRGGDFFNPFDPVVWKMMPGYLFLQSFYFLGGAWFRSRPFPKTTLAIGILIFSMIFLSWISMRVLFGPYWGDMDTLALTFQTLSHSYAGYASAILYGIAVLWVLMNWYVTWLRLKETQVSDGV